MSEQFETKHFIVGFKEDAALFSCTLSMDSEFQVDFGANAGQEYTGIYEATPSNQAQILPTANRILTDNVVVNPIPNNYGLITYNGSVITVS